MLKLTRFLIAWLLVATGHAADAATCASADVQTAINATASDGTVNIPAGNCTWTSGVTVSGKTIHLVGAGTDITNITHDIAAGGKAIQITTTGNYPSTVSFITFIESANGYATDGIVKVISTTQVNWRIHHCFFRDLNRRGIVVSGYEGGLIDHCMFNTDGDGVAQGVTIYGNLRESWSRAPSWGTNQAVYIEDCLFDFEGPNDAAIEQYRGARAVIRYNVIYNSPTGAHGHDSDSYANGSTFSWEIYHNTFILPTNEHKPSYHQNRGGSGVLWSNRYWARWQGGGVNTFYGQNMALDTYRATATEIYPGGLATQPLDGSNVVDGNTAVTNGSGTHTGSNNAATLTDSSKSWTADQHIPVTPTSTYVRPYYIWNRTDSSGCFITANAATTVTCTLTGGVENDWDTGDSYVITFGYPAADQIGRTGPEVVYADYSEQPSSPCYMWDNIHNQGLGTQEDVDYTVAHVYATSIVQPNAAEFIQSGREFYNNTIKPGYTPYTYPHPLTGTVYAPRSFNRRLGSH